MWGTAFRVFLAIFVVVFFIYLIIGGYFIYKYIRSDDSNRSYFYNRIKIIGIVGLVMLILFIITLAIVYMLEPEKPKFNVTNSSNLVMTEAASNPSFVSVPPQLIDTNDLDSGVDSERKYYTRLLMNQ